MHIAGAVLNVEGYEGWGMLEKMIERKWQEGTGCPLLARRITGTRWQSAILISGQEWQEEKNREWVVVVLYDHRQGENKCMV